MESNRTWFSPRLDGSGSSYSEYDADLFPLYVQAVENQANARHRLEDEPEVDSDETDDAALTAAHQHAAAVAGRNATRRGKAQFELVTGKAADTLEPLDDQARPSGKPSVLVVAPIDSLIDGSTPAWLLSPLAGRVKVTSSTLQRWMANGADTRLIGIDDTGEVVGVGRRSRYARGALRDAIIARDLHDTAPCSTTPAVLCDVDHVLDWDHGGPTDAPNLTVLSRRWPCRRPSLDFRHRTLPVPAPSGLQHGCHKTKNRWKLARHRDGTRTWTNTWSGYRIRQPRPAHLPRGRDGPDG